MTSSNIIVGIRGDVIALDRETGKQLWRAVLKGADFVNVLLDNDRVIAATKGEIYCLDAATGETVWHNELLGEGRGLATIATAAGTSSAMPSFREKQVRDAAAAAIASTGIG